jgi:rubrerythrin
VEKRSDDVWFDLSLRQLRRGEVNFYRVKDFLTGKWLFKVCRDREVGKVLVKAIKCPPGPSFAQLEGDSMVFQESVVKGMFYDVLSIMQADENERLSRKVVSSVEDVPSFIKENFEIKTYEEATGRAAPGKSLVTLCRREDEKAMITLFLFERAWSISKVAPEDKLKKIEEQEAQQPKMAKKEIDTGQVWTCPICGKQHRLVHVETEKAVRHALFRV